MNKLKIWRLKSKEEQRFKRGHPWVYSNELQDSPKGIQTGELLELHDASGNFLAFGFGNPGSLIAFRALSRNKEDVEHIKASDAGLAAFFEKQLTRAFEFRLRWFAEKTSFRAVYGEADDLPGLVVDRFRGAKKTVYVIQPHSAGMDQSLEHILAALQKTHAQFSKDQDARVILRRDAGSREREGLEKLPPEVRLLSTLEVMTDASDLNPFQFAVPGQNQKEIFLSADLIKGQKTGFFFDQLENIRLTADLLARKRAVQSGRGSSDEGVQVLDLCSYVGQWGVHLADALLNEAPHKTPVSVTMVDASESALTLADQNLKNAFKEEFANKRLEVNRFKADVLDLMPMLKQNQYDVVIADPPALIKSRKVIPQGKQAYVQLMSEAIRRTKPGGMIVACSCSQLLSPEDFVEVLAKASRKAGRTVRWIAQGSPSVDHFQRFEFREGHYLKCWIGEL